MKLVIFFIICIYITEAKNFRTSNAFKHNDKQKSNRRSSQKQMKVEREEDSSYLMSDLLKYLEPDNDEIPNGISAKRDKKSSAKHQNSTKTNDKLHNKAHDKLHYKVKKEAHNKVKKKLDKKLSGKRNQSQAKINKTMHIKNVHKNEMNVLNKKSKDHLQLKSHNKSRKQPQSHNKKLINTQTKNGTGTPTKTLIDKPTKKAIYIGTEKSIDASTEELINKPTENVIDKPTRKVINKPTEKVIDKSTEQVIDKPTEQVIDKPTEKIIGKPTKEAIDKPTKKVIDKLTEKVIDKPTKKVIDKTTKKVVDKPTEKLIDKSTKKGKNDIPSTTAVGIKSYQEILDQEKNIPENPFILRNNFSDSKVSNALTPEIKDTLLTTKEASNITAPANINDFSENDTSFIEEKNLTLLADQNHKNNTQKNGKSKRKRKKGIINLSGWSSPKESTEPKFKVLKLHQIDFAKLIKHILNNKPRTSSRNTNKIEGEKIAKMNRMSTEKTDHFHSPIYSDTKSELLSSNHGRSRQIAFENGGKNLGAAVARNVSLALDFEDGLAEEQRRVIQLERNGRKLQPMDYSAFTGQEARAKIKEKLQSKKKRFHNSRKSFIPHPIQGRQYDTRYKKDSLPMYFPPSTFPQQLLEFPSQYPELLDLQPMNKLYTSVQGLDANEENLVGGFLRRERLEEEKFREGDPDKVILADDKGDLYQDEAAVEDAMKGLRVPTQRKVIADEQKQQYSSAKDKTILQFLRQTAIKKKQAKIQRLEDRLQTLKRLEESRRKHQFMKADPTNTAPSLPHISTYSPSKSKGNGVLTEQKSPDVKNFFHQPDGDWIEHPTDHKRKSTNSSTFQDALYDRGNVLNIHFHDATGAKKQLSSHQLPVPPLDYFMENDQELKTSIELNDDIDQKHSNINTATPLNITNKVNKQSVEHQESKNIHVDNQASVEDLKTQDTSEVTGVQRGMNEFTFNGQVKLDPKYQGNVKIVHGTPPPDFVAAFATQFPPTRFATPFGPGFSLPPGHATMQANLPTFKNGYPWSWYKNRKLPTTSRYRNNHPQLATKQPTRSGNYGIAPGKQTTPQPRTTHEGLPTNTQPPEVLNIPTVASLLKEAHTVPMNHSAGRNNSSKQAQSNLNSYYSEQYDKPSMKPVATVSIDPSDNSSAVNQSEITTTRIPETTTTPMATNSSNTTATMEDVRDKSTSEPKPKVIADKSSSKGLTTLDINAVDGSTNNIASLKKAEKSKSLPIAYVTYEKNSRLISQPNEIILDPKDSQDYETKEHIVSNNHKRVEHSKITTGHKDPRLLGFHSLSEHFDANKEEKIELANQNNGHHTPNPDYELPILHTPTSKLNAVLKPAIQKPAAFENPRPTSKTVEDTGDKRDLQQYSSYTIKEVKEEDQLNRETMENNGNNSIPGSAQNTTSNDIKQNNQKNVNQEMNNDTKSTETYTEDAKEPTNIIQSSANSTSSSFKTQTQKPTDLNNLSGSINSSGEEIKLTTPIQLPYVAYTDSKNSKELETIKSDDKIMDGKIMPTWMEFMHDSQQGEDSETHSILEGDKELTKTDAKLEEFHNENPLRLHAEENGKLQLSETSTAESSIETVKPKPTIRASEAVYLPTAHGTKPLPVNMFIRLPGESSETTAILQTSVLQQAPAAVSNPTTTTTPAPTPPPQPSLQTTTTTSHVTKLHAPFESTPSSHVTKKSFDIIYPRINSGKENGTPGKAASTYMPQVETLGKTNTINSIMYASPQEQLQPILQDPSQTKYQPIIIAEPIIAPAQPAVATRSAQTNNPESHEIPLLTPAPQSNIGLHVEKFKPTERQVINVQMPLVYDGTKSPYDSELNMDDMYWTDSVEEIEHACRQEKGTNLVVNILAFGDSLTRGYYNIGKSHHPYTMKLQFLLNKLDAKRCFIVENEGKDGDLAFGEMPKRMEDVLKNSKKRFEWVIILGGTNDIYNKKHAGKRTAQELTQNILSVHNIAHHHGSRSVAITIPEVLCESNDSCQDMKQIREAVNDNIRTYALDHKNSVLLCDLAGSLARHRLNNKLFAQFFEGGLHLKPRGYETMAKLIYDSLKQVLD